jgi:hypothetical protein
VTAWGIVKKSSLFVALCLFGLIALPVSGLAQKTLTSPGHFVLRI